MMRCRIRLKKDLSETKSISTKNEKIQIALGICLAPCIRSRRDRFPSLDIFLRAVVPIGQKAKTANMFSFGQAVRPKELLFGKYLYGVSSLTRSLISLISSRIWLMTLPGPFRSRASVILIDSPFSLSTSSIFSKWSFPSMIWKASV